MEHRKIPMMIAHVKYRYDSDTGCFYNRATGKQVGHDSGRGYQQVTIYYGGERSNKQTLRANRLAWAMHTGIDPGEFEIDHKNRVRDDNSISNLRPVTRAENIVNSSNKSATPGVHRTRGKWRAHYEKGTHKWVGKRHTCPVLALMERGNHIHTLSETQSYICISSVVTDVMNDR